MTAEELMAELDLDSLGKAEFLLTLPPEAIELVRAGQAFVGTKHHHDWPQDRNPTEICPGQQHSSILCVNVNDTFVYACGDAEDIPTDEITQVAALIKQHGPWASVCWVAKKRNENPVVEICEEPGYQATWKAMYGDLVVNPNECNKVIPRW